MFWGFLLVMLLGQRRPGCIRFVRLLLGISPVVLLRRLLVSDSVVLQRRVGKFIGFLFLGGGAKKKK